MKVSNILLGAAAMAAMTGVANANYVEVFSEAEANAGLLASPFLDTVVTDGSDTYAISRDFGAGNGVITKFDGVGFTEIMSATQWDAGKAASSPPGGFFYAAVVGSNIEFINFFDNTFYQVDKTSGAVTVKVSDTTFNLAAGVLVNLSSSGTIASDGSAYGYEQESDAIFSVTPGGVVGVELSTAQIEAVTGDASTADAVRGAMELVGTDLYFSNDDTDTLYKWDTVNDIGSVVLTTTELEALSDDIDGRAGVDDLFYAPDGLMYFYEDDADYIYSFDPSDPVGTLAVVLTEAELAAGPAGSDIVAQLTWYDGNIAWTRQGTGFYAVPEPASLALLGLGGLALIRRR